MLSARQVIERNDALRWAELAVDAKAAGEKDIAEKYVYGSAHFCGSKKNPKELLVSPEEIITLRDKELFITRDVVSIGYAIYCYFAKRLTFDENQLSIAYGMLFEAGRLQGIREERQRRKKGSTRV
jgi:hypothetical protein